MNRERHKGTFLSACWKPTWGRIRDQNTLNETHSLCEHRSDAPTQQRQKIRPTLGTKMLHFLSTFSKLMSAARRSPGSTLRKRNPQRHTSFQLRIKAHGGACVCVSKPVHTRCATCCHHVLRPWRIFSSKDAAASQRPLMQCKRKHCMYQNTQAVYEHDRPWRTQLSRVPTFRDARLFVTQCARAPLALGICSFLWCACVGAALCVWCVCSCVLIRHHALVFLACVRECVRVNFQGSEQE